jgi:hypothetical protein
VTISRQDRRSCRPSIKKVVVTLSLDRAFDSVTKKGTYRRWRTRNPRDCVNRLWTVVFLRCVSRDTHGWVGHPVHPWCGGDPNMGLALSVGQPQILRQFQSLPGDAGISNASQAMYPLQQTCKRRVFAARSSSSQSQSSFIAHDFDSQT